MKSYIVNQNTDDKGYNEVHIPTECNNLPLVQNRVSIGSHDSCQQALAEARRRGYNPDGCAHCAPGCHKG